MRPPYDLMERLAAADPQPAAEPLSPDQQRDADALLERLLATPVEERRSRRRWARLAVATASAAVVVFVALNVFGSSAPGPGVIDKAIAALKNEDAVYHYVARVRFNASDFDPILGKNVRLFESWRTLGGRMHWKDYTVRNGQKGKLLDDVAGRRRPGRRGGPAIRYDAHANTIWPSGFGAGSGPGAPSLDAFDPGGSLRSLQSEGRLRVAGTVEVAGRPAYRLVSGRVPGSNGSTEHAEFLVDAETYLPVAERYSRREANGSTVTGFTRFLTYERLPLNDETRELLDLDPHPGAKCDPNVAKMTGKRDPGFPNPCRGR